MAGSVITHLAVRGYQLPLITVTGAQPGPTLSIISGIHGDEYEGPAALYRFLSAIVPATLRGTILALPVANPPAVAAISRTTPPTAESEGENLARVFPGDPQGTLAQALAAAITEAVIQPAHFLIDLHTGGVRYAMPTMAGYYSADPRSRAAAEAFGAPVLWGHPVIPPGRTLSVALARGIPFLYTEGHGGGRLHAADTACFEQGLWNVARHLGMLPGPLVRQPVTWHLTGDGNTDRGSLAPHDGFFLPTAELLTRVQTGTPIGTLLDYAGQVTTQIQAERDGVLALLRLSPSVRAGESLYLLCDELPAGQ